MKLSSLNSIGMWFLVFCVAKTQLYYWRIISWHPCKCDMISWVDEDSERVKVSWHLSLLPILLAIHLKLVITSIHSPVWFSLHIYSLTLTIKNSPLFNLTTFLPLQNSPMNLYPLQRRSLYSFLGCQILLIFPSLFISCPIKDL